MKYLINISLIILATGVLISCATSTTDPKNLVSQSLKKVQVIRVIDGDTLEVLINGTQHTVRLFGVDTPERGEHCYREAAERTRQLSGDVAFIEAGPRAEDRYGRLLFYLYTHSGESIDTKLIQEGLATAWTRDGQHKDMLINAEYEAKEKGSGCLW